MSPELEEAVKAAIAAVSLWLVYKDPPSELEAKRALDHMLWVKENERKGKS